MEEGYISLYRKFLSWEWFEDEKAVKLFIFLLLKANWKEKRWRGQKIGRGQLITSSVKLSEQTNLSRSTVNRLLKKFELSGEVVRKADNKKTLVTICNYDKYQIFRREDGQPEAEQVDSKTVSKRTTSGQQTDTTKKGNNNNNEKNKEGRGRKKFRPPTDEEFLNYLKEYLEKKGIGATPEERTEILENFRDHYEAVGWKVGKNKMVDWQAAARNSLKWEKNQRVLNPDPQKSKSGLKFPNFYDPAFVAKYCQDGNTWIEYKKHLISLGFEERHGGGGTNWVKTTKK